jgi:hypothetical protein
VKTGCACGGAAGGWHRIGCQTTAATQPHAMVNDTGDVFYPDSAIDAALFALDHGARFADPAAGAAWLTEVTDDPTPAAPGCGCVVRQHPEWGEVTVHPQGGCPTHPVLPATPAPDDPPAAHLPGAVGLAVQAGPR